MTDQLKIILKACITQACALSFVFIFTDNIQAQNFQDTIYLMNGHVIASTVTDTLPDGISILSPEKTSSKLNYEWDQLYLVKYESGLKKFYYYQDSTIGNWFTRDEMWMFMKGENDARNGFKARGALIGSGAIGLLAGMTGSFWAPLAPYSFMALSGVPKVKIKHSTVSDLNYLKSEPYILGYERVARQKLKIKSIIGGTAGLIIGYGFYFAFHKNYPETINIGFNR